VLIDRKVYKFFKIYWGRGEQLYIERKKSIKVVGPVPGRS
jgi:hypothetical protein